MFTPSDVNLARVQRELATLSQYGRQPSGGISRFTFSEAHQAAMGQVADWMNAAGLRVTFDRWGNLLGRAPGFDESPQVVLTGSHLDSVPNGGNYDGPLGVISSLEAVRLIRERNVALRNPVEVVAFIEEEGASFHGLWGSLLATGGLPDAEIAALTDRNGRAFLDVLREIEFPYPIDRNRDLGKGVAAYIELHIEQGKRLQDAGVPIGVVTGIAGPNFLRVRFEGRADHAGATAYPDRQDTLLAAAEVIVGVRELGVSRFAGKGHLTVGRINVRPNAVNVVAGETDFAVDFRAADAQTAVDMRTGVESLLTQACEKHAIKYAILDVESVPPVQTPSHIRAAIEQAAEQACVPCLPLISWAAHDAMVMANVTAAGMIFVPCRDGRSHCPEEYIEPEDIAAGVATLANTLVLLAQ